MKHKALACGDGGDGVWIKTIVLTPAIAGAASPADFAGIPFPAVAGMEFPAVAEDLSLAHDAGGLPMAARVSEPLRPAAVGGPLSDVEATPSVELWGACGAL